jgi:hypothetical protein
MVHSKDRSQISTFSKKADNLGPMEEMLVEEHVHIIAVARMISTLAIMFDPVKTRILKLRGNTALNAIGFNVLHECVLRIQAANVLLEHFGHDVYAALGYRFVHLSSVDPELAIVAPVPVKEKVAECWMM